MWKFKFQLIKLDQYWGVDSSAKKIIYIDQKGIKI